MEPLNVKGLTLAELTDVAVGLGEQRFRGKQLFDWLYTKEAASFSEMTSLSALLRKKFDTRLRIDSLPVVRVQESAYDGTRKFLFQLGDGRAVESVLIPPATAFRGTEARTEEEQRRLTLCVSTQAGCPLDCAFCATATMGFLRNLTAGEIIDQVLQVKKAAGRRITNLVFMGMGEPLLNYESVMKAVEIITTGMGIAARRITISTAGWVPGILRMAGERRKAKLAVSLHSLREDVRARLMPVARKYPLAELLDAVGAYYRAVKRRVTFEYILFDGLNDTAEDAALLVRLARKIPCKINIIPYHVFALPAPDHPAAALLPTPPTRTEHFVDALRRGHCTVFVRSSAGEDIAAACGQLAVRTAPRRVARKPAAVGPEPAGGPR